MRLKHIHIAGFKSFVDPATIPATARLTGIVGPNGCGKSNVIDAVRWVLGESKARELRGASMQDVIFNGSTARKPASRASVELLFDNAEGKAAGQWAQYAEIAVKRVLTRNGDSSYWINNVQVRKKDMADLFLGTGLGGDAYAIIEQGMISRIIEARPEELRGFLEEAAGVSKYKERRRETESRLRDTRENLERVADICAELARQLEKLGAQAEVARRFFSLDAERELKSRLLALARRDEARARQASVTRELDAARTEIEACLAEVRRLEAALEEQRLGQFEATETLNGAQAAFYQASADVAQAEQALRHVREARQRLEQELALNTERERAARAEQAATESEIALRRAEHAEAARHAETLREQARHSGAELPAAEAALREAQSEVAGIQRALAQHEQDIQVQEASRAHAERAMEQFKTRERRLLQEREQLTAQDFTALTRQQQELEALETRLTELGQYLNTARAALPPAEAALREARQAQDAANREAHRLNAELSALRRVQDSAQAREKEGTAWLARAGLEQAERLWQCIQVEPGWEAAVEAALGETLAALAAEARPEWLQTPPDARYEVVLPRPLPATPRPASPPETAVGDSPPLIRARIQTAHPGIARLLDDRLALAYAADSLAEAMRQREQLPPGAFIATREGHRVSRDGLIFNAPEKGHHGLLARAREIERLHGEAAEATARQQAAQARLAEHETALQRARQQADALQGQITPLQGQIGQQRALLARSQETARRVDERRAQIQRELDELYTQLGDEENAWNEAGERQAEAEENRAAARARLEESRRRRQTVEQRVSGAREAQRRAEREAQEAGFQVRALENRLKELDASLQRAARALLELAGTRERLQGDYAAAQETPLKLALDAALASRQSADAALVAAREALEGANATLRALDAERVRAEHALGPLQGRAQALELKLQEARLQEERYAEELREVDLDVLRQQAAQAGWQEAQEAWLKQELERIERAVSALGAVNMAALEELKAAEERKQYLDAQALDLETAANTLEEAIRRIDAETRSRLKATYDQVSASFRTLFVELFGGGNAELVLTGEEILDAGLTVIAQPPGKKNSSIQLLSGGEKALTALSLVFAFFRLNPAPFCLLDEVDAPLDDSNTERYCAMVKKMSAETQFLFITHNRLTMEMAEHLVGVTMPEPGVSRPVAVDVENAVRLAV